MNPKISADIRKSYTELEAAFLARIMTISANCEMTFLLRNIGLTFPLPIMPCLFGAHVASGCHLNFPRSWEGEESQREADAYLQIRLQLVTGNTKKIWRYQNSIIIESTQK